MSARVTDPWWRVGPTARRAHAARRRSGGFGGPVLRGLRSLGRRLGVGRLGALACPRLVELDAPATLLGLLQRQPGAERLARATLEARHRPCGAPGLDQLLGDGHRKLLTGLALPDHESAARVLARPARVALAVLVDVVAAHRTRPQVRARDADVLELGVELGDGRLGEFDDVAHERLARVRPGLDLGQPALPVAGERGRGERVLSEQADDVEALLGYDQRAPVALDVADLEQPLDDRRAGRRRADPGVLHRLAQLLLLDELAGRLHRGQQPRLGVAARRLGHLLGRRDLEHARVLPPDQL